MILNIISSSFKTDACIYVQNILNSFLKFIPYDLLDYRLNFERLYEDKSQIDFRQLYGNE